MRKIFFVAYFLFFSYQIIYSYNLKIKDATGKIFHFKEPPKRVISLGPSITENLYLLGVGEKIVGNTTYCDTPEDATKKEKVGTYIQPNIEKIILLSPDIIFTTKEGRKKESVYKMRKLGLQVFILESEDNVDILYENFLTFGKIFDKEKEAKEIIEYYQKRIDIVKNKLKNVKKKKVFYQIGASPIVTAGEKTLSNQIIEFAGGENIAKKSKVKYPKYSREEVIKQNPDAIIIVGMGIITEEEIKNWKKYKNLNAVKNNNIYSVDANTVCRATPKRFADAVEMIYNILHK